MIKKEENTFYAIQEDSNQLPHAAAPHDALRFGLPTFKQDALPAHPVETMTKNVSCAAPPCVSGSG